MAGPSVVVRVLGDLTGLSKSVGDAGTAAQGAAGKMASAFHGAIGALNQTGVLGPFSGALAGVGASLDAISEHGKTAGGVMLGVGAGVAGAGAALAAMGSKDQAAHAQLQQAVEATGKSYDDYSKQVEEAIKHQERFGHTANQTQDALRILTQATGDPAKALQYLGTASDLAAAKHEDLSAAATSLGKAYNGSTRLLKEFGLEAGTKTTTAAKDLTAATNQAGTAADAQAKAHQRLADVQALLAGKSKLTTAEQISLRNAQQNVVVADQKAMDAHTKLAGAHDTVTKAAHSQADTMDELGNKLKGQASAQADTFMGKLDAMKAKVEDSVAQFGQKYGPAITAAGVAMSGMGAAMELISALGPIMGAALDIALGPIGLIILGIAALIAIGYVIYRNWDTIWSFIKSIIEDVWDWIKEHWPLLLDIFLGPIGFVIGFVIQHFHEIKDTIVGIWNDIVKFFKGLPGDIEHIFKDVWKGIKTGFLDVINAVIDLWNQLHFKTPHISLGPFGSVGGETIGVTHIDHIKMAAGGIVTAPTLALLGEAGPEAVVPLGAGRPGPVMVIQQAQFNDPVDVDLLSRQLAFALSAGLAV
jgi:hypothetical protein